MRLIIMALVVTAIGVGGYLYGRGDQGVSQETVEEIRAKAAEGHPDALYTLATAHRHGAFGVAKDPGAAMRLFWESYRAGMVPAGTALGHMLLNGELGPDPDAVRGGEKILRDCADKQSADAAFLLARHFARRGVSEDAKVYARKALDLHHHETETLDRIAATGTP